MVRMSTETHLDRILARTRADVLQLVMATRTCRHYSSPGLGACDHVTSRGHAIRPPAHNTHKPRQAFGFFADGCDAYLKLEVRHNLQLPYLPCISYDLGPRSTQTLHPCQSFKYRGISHFAVNALRVPANTVCRAAVVGVVERQDSSSEGVSDASKTGPYSKSNAVGPLRGTCLGPIPRQTRTDNSSAEVRA